MSSPTASPSVAAAGSASGGGAAASARFDCDGDHGSISPDDGAAKMESRCSFSSAAGAAATAAAGVAPPSGPSSSTDSSRVDRKELPREPPRDPLGLVAPLRRILGEGGPSPRRPQGETDAGSALISSSLRADGGVCPLADRAVPGERDGARRAPGDVDEFRCGDVEGPRSLAGEECDEAPDAPDVHPGERPPDGERPVPGERAWPGERDAERTDS